MFSEFKFNFTYAQSGTMHLSMQRFQKNIGRREKSKNVTYNGLTPDLLRSLERTIKYE